MSTNNKVVTTVRLNVWWFLGVCLVIGTTSLNAFGQDPAATAPMVLDTQLREYLETQPWWWMAKERAYPLAVEDALAYGLLDAAERQAAEQVRADRLASPLTLQSVPLPALGWESIGPAHYVPDNSSSGQKYSGRIVSSAVDPGDADHWLIGPQNGGLWQTRDAGATWTPRIDDFAPLNMSAIAFAPGDPNIVYTVTKAGLLKSLDGGDTWSLINTDSPFNGKSARVLAVSPVNSNVVLAAIDNRFTNIFPENGVHKSTDGGLTWMQKLSGNGTDHVVDPGNFARQYAAIGPIGPGVPAALGLHRSTNSGDLWTNIGGPWDGSSARIGLAIAPSNPNVLYVLVESSTAANQVLGLWKTTNAWDATPTWTALPVVEDFSHGRPLTVDPTNADVLYHGANYLSRFDGSTWTNVTANELPTGTHVDFYSLTWIGTRLLATNDGGIFSSPTGAPPWTTHNIDLRINEFYWGIGLRPGTADFALIGAQDASTLGFTGSPVWKFIAPTGDGFANAVSFTAPSTDWLVSSYWLDIWRTRDGGLTRDNDDIDSGIDNIGRSPQSKFLQCPTGDTVIAPTDNLWRSDDVYSAAQPTWTTNGPEMGYRISALAFAPSDGTCRTYAFGTGNSRLRATASGGAGWVDIDPLGTLPGRGITGLAFAPDDANIIYVTLSGYDSFTPGHIGHLFRGTGIFSGSPQWTNISPPIDIPHNTVAIDPVAPRTIYVGTDLGLWVTTSGGGAWTYVESPELPPVAVTDVKINPPAGNQPFFSENFDGVVAPVLPAGWTTSTLTGTANLWVTNSDSADSAPNSAIAGEPSEISDNVLVSPTITLPVSPSSLTFRHQYLTELTHDGGVLEMAIGGGPFQDIVAAGGSFEKGGYTGTISTDSSSPIADRQAWTGDSGGYITTVVNMPSVAAGQEIRLRWRMATDVSAGGPDGWSIDTITPAGSSIFVATYGRGAYRRHRSYGDADADSDGVPDQGDNCTLVANPSQCDSDGDGYGNRCDGDLNDNGATNAQDVAMFRQQLGLPSTPPTYNQADINCNGAVNAQDVAMFRQLLGSPSGPSGREWKVRLYNIDDLGRVELNGQQILMCGYAQSCEVEFGPLLVFGNNSLRILVENTPGSGWTYGYEVTNDGVIFESDSCGTVGVLGCQDNDQTAGVVLDRTLGIPLFIQ